MAKLRTTTQCADHDLNLKSASRGRLEKFWLACFGEFGFAELGLTISTIFEVETIKELQSFNDIKDSTNIDQTLSLKLGAS